MLMRIIEEEIEMNCQSRKHRSIKIELELYGFGYNVQKRKYQRNIRRKRREIS